MRPTSAKRFSTLTLAVLGLALAACGDSDSGNLTFSARGAATAAPNTARAALVVSDGVTVSRVRMVIRDIKFGLPGEENEIDAAGGPFLVDLADAQLEGGIQQMFEVTVPAGTYDEIRFVLHKLEDGQRIGDAAIDATRASVVVDLTDASGTFQWTSQMNEPQRIFGTFVVDGSGGPDNVTLVVDPTSWFRDGGGGFLDPRSEGNRSQIENNIEASLQVFEDDDRDGHSDDGPNHT